MNSIFGTGAVGSNDLIVSEHSPANLSIEIAAGYVIVPGTQGAAVGRNNAGTQNAYYSTLPTAFTSQGVYNCVNPTSVTLALNEANATNPRIDLICASVQDAFYSGSFNQALLQVVTGTPAGSPSPPTPPENTVVLAQVEVKAKATKIEAANITDTRPLSPLQWGRVNAAAVLEAGYGRITAKKEGTGLVMMTWASPPPLGYGVLVTPYNTVEPVTAWVKEIKSTISFLVATDITGIATNCAFTFLIVS